MIKMKDSGIEWVGEIPENWEVKPIRAMFEEVAEKNKRGKVKNALKFTYGNIVPKMGFDAEEDSYVADTILNYTVVEPGTIMLNGLNLNFDFVTQRIGLVKESGAITSAYMAFRSKDISYMSPEYATYLFKSYDECKAFHNMGGGVRKILNFSEFQTYYVVIPSIEEQTRIVNYLDKKCAEIDGLVSEIKEQIEILEQYKRSLIYETVTKGLDPTAKMKDSGIEWVGEIPENWTVKRAKYCFIHCKQIAGFKSDNYERLALTLQGVIKRSKEDNQGLQPDNFSGYQVLREGELVFKLIDLQNVQTSRVGLSAYTGIVSPAYIILRCKDGCNMRYAEKWFLSLWRREIFNHLGDDGVRSSLNQDDLLNTPYVFPPFSEQVAIADYLDKKCAEIDSIIAEKKKQMESILEYKKSLIYEYVTGKREVVQNA